VSIQGSGASRPRVIVIPKPLAGYFYERLTRQYAARRDVTVVVDRRVAERRRTAETRRLPERRARERRANQVDWSLEEMPCASVAAGD
jgi:hypothetical protein